MVTEVGSLVANVKPEESHQVSHKLRKECGSSIKPTLESGFHANLVFYNFSGPIFYIHLSSIYLLESFQVSTLSSIV